MSHDHEQPHDHPHSHSHEPVEVPDAMNLEVPDGALAPRQLDRRRFLQSAGVLGAGTAALSAFGLAGASPALAADGSVPRSDPAPLGGFRWLSGDHHIHTQFSPDGIYRVIDQVQHANAYGLDWMVITDHGTAQHTRIGVEKVNPDIKAARALIKDTLVFQGLEWNIPAAEHGTVFVHPGANEVAVLKQFEVDYDGSGPDGTGARSKSTPANEALARTGLTYLASAVDSKRVQDALMFANHPARKGIDSPHEIRGWRDTAPSIAVGMEGAPGHQAAGIPAPIGPGSGRGYYDNSPGSSSFAGYPLESYRTYGGFDWMTSTVGGLWDSLLAEGKPWWITANSDSHQVYAETAQRGDQNFTTQGFYGGPMYDPSGPKLDNGDFWPGYYSRTHVGSTDFSYAAVMAGLRAGRVWVDHGGLIGALDVHVRAAGKSVPLGGVLVAPRGSKVEVVTTITTATRPNWSEFVPKLAKVDLIKGNITGPTQDTDNFRAPGTRVYGSFDARGITGTKTVVTQLGNLSGPIYLRMRGSDGARLGTGLYGASVDPAGPVQDVVGDADPWKDLWFYTNPIFVYPS